MQPQLIDNVNKTLRDDLMVTIKSGSRVSIAAASFSIYAFKELKEQLGDIREPSNPAANGKSILR